MLKRNLKNDKFAVSVVIGVVLMVTVSISLATVVLSYTNDSVQNRKRNGTVFAGVSPTKMLGIATSDGTLTFVASEENDVVDFIITGPSGKTVIVTPDDIGMTYGGIANGDPIDIHLLAEVAFDEYESGDYTVSCIATDIKTELTSITGKYNFDLNSETSNSAPVVSDIPDQTITEGSSFTTISLDYYVTDEDTDEDEEDSDSAISWLYSGNSELTVAITNRVAKVTTPNGNWNGEETITFTATDTGELSDSDAATFTVDPVNDLPDEPSDPNPGPGESNVDVDVVLSWDGGDPDLGDEVTYYVYFGKTMPLQLVPDGDGGQSGTSYDFNEDLDYSTTYYWRVVALDNYEAEKEGPTWSFSTEVELVNNLPDEPSDPNPGPGESNVDVDVVLSWDGGDPDPGDEVTYYVYFGATMFPPLVPNGGQSGTSYDPPGDLDYLTTYYWKIVAWDNQGAEKEGQTWSFTTLEIMNDAEP